MEENPSTREPDPVEDALVHRDHLRNWLVQRFSLVDDPDDIVQEAYTRLVACCRTGPVVNARALLFVTARNLALNRIRRIGYERRDPIMLDSHFEHLGTEVPSPHQVACSNEAVSLLTEAIAALPPRCRQVFTLRKIHGLSQREIAERLGISVNTVQVQGVLGLKKCREFFERKGLLNDRFS